MTEKGVFTIQIVFFPYWLLKPVFGQMRIHLKTTNSPLHQASPKPFSRVPWPLDPNPPPQAYLPPRAPDLSACLSMSGQEYIPWIPDHLSFKELLAVSGGPNRTILLMAGRAAAFRLQVLNTPGVWTEIFPQDKWKSSAPLERAINTTRTPSARRRRRHRAAGGNFLLRNAVFVRHSFQFTFSGNCSVEHTRVAQMCTLGKELVG